MLQVNQPEDRVIDEKSFDTLVEQFYASLWRFSDQTTDNGIPHVPGDPTQFTDEVDLTEAAHDPCKISY